MSFQGRPLLTSAKVAGWHVGYGGYTGNNHQRVGFSDAVSCPVFSAAALRLVPPAGNPRLLADDAPTALTAEGNAAWPAGTDRRFVAGAVQITPDWDGAELV